MARESGDYGRNLLVDRCTTGRLFPVRFELTATSGTGPRSFEILAALHIVSTSSMKNDVLTNEAIRTLIHGLGQETFGSNAVFVRK